MTEQAARAEKEVRAHIDYKVSVLELDPLVAHRMRKALDAGAAPDYAALFSRASKPAPLQPTMYHASDRAVRGSILCTGLHPGTGQNWDTLGLKVSPGVYVSPAPDTIGKWTKWPEWDVWEVNVVGLATPFAHDPLNPGCYFTEGTIGPWRLKLYGTYGSQAPWEEWEH